MTENDYYFTCSNCGKCCNRSPEVELSETLQLADFFVFRLMFKTYTLASSLSEHINQYSNYKLSIKNKESYLETRRAHEQNAIHITNNSIDFQSKKIKVKKYIYASAITLDLVEGKCSQLKENLCGIYDKRPLACKSVPFHYSTNDAILEDKFTEFVNNPSHGCLFSEAENLVLKNGKLVDEAFIEVRRKAILLMQNDKFWKALIKNKIVEKSFSRSIFPSLQQIQSCDSHSATTISMLPAWKLAFEFGIISHQEFKQIILSQNQLIIKILEKYKGKNNLQFSKILFEMSIEYKAVLESNTFVDL